LEVLLRTNSVFGAAKLQLDGRNARGRAPLHVAARKGFADLITLLLGARSDPDSQDADGWTALHHACFNGNDDVVEELVRGGAHTFVRGSLGFTPLMAASLPGHCGDLKKSTKELLAPPDTVGFGQKIAPVLNDREIAVYDKLRTLLELPGVNYNPHSLRLYEQLFPSIAGPSKVRLQKFWENLIRPLIRRMRTRETDLDPLSCHLSEEAAQQRAHDIESRLRDQKLFLVQWLLDSMGPKFSPEWKFENRNSYIEEWHSLIDEELDIFQVELDELYAKMLEQEGGKELAAMPAEEVLTDRYRTQLSAHPIPVWVEEPDPAGAFEALRNVCGLGPTIKDDDEAIMSFAEMLTLNPDMDTGAKFWKNIYRFWLCRYAEALAMEFHAKIKSVVESFNGTHEKMGRKATYTIAKVKSYERIKEKEKLYGTSSHETYEGRTVAGKVLDVVRGSITVDGPLAAQLMVEDYFKPLRLLENKMILVKITNRFSREAETQRGYRSIEMNIFWDGGARLSPCGRPGMNLNTAIVGEVQIVLQDFLNVKKRRHVVWKCSNGIFDHPPEPVTVTRSRSEPSLDSTVKSLGCEDLVFGHATTAC